MLFVVNHWIRAKVQFSAKLYSVNVLLQSRVKVCENINHYISFVPVESCLFCKLSQLWFNEVFILPSVKCEMDAFQTNPLDEFQIAIVYKANVQTLIEIDAGFAVCKLLE